MSTPERAGWYDDPEDETRLRYFDGIIWSDRTVPRRAPQPEPPVEATLPHDGPATDVFGRPSRPPEPARQQPAGQHLPAQQPGWGGPPPGWGAAQPPPGPTTQDGQPLASFGARAGAYLIDGLIVMLINLVVSGWALWLWVADYWSFVWDAAQRGDQDAVNELTPDQLFGFFEWRYYFIAIGLALLVQAVYHIGFLVLRNATPGKMVLGLTVRPTDRPGRLSAGTAFMRMLLPLGVGVLSVVPLVSYLVWFVTVADLLWPLKDPRRQALHDKIAGTQVVKGKQPRDGVGSSGPERQ